MSIGELLYTNVCGGIRAELKTWYGHANGRSQKEEVHENNAKPYF